MELILNEHAFAQQAIACGTVGKKPAQTLGCISRYLCYEGYEKPQIEETLHRFMRENYANYHAVQWSAAIEHISSRADRRPLLQANQIEITQEELASIRALASQPLERLCFTLLCLAKYAQLINPANDGWVTQKWSAIFRMAHVQAGKERQAAMLHTLREKGLIAFSRGVDNLHIHVLFFRPASQTACALDDLREPGLFYLSLQGERIIRCACCGKLLKPKTNNQKYCPDCRAEMNLKKTLARYFYCGRGTGKSPPSV